MLTRTEVLELIKSKKMPENGSELLFDLNRLNNNYTLMESGDETVRFKLDFTQSKQVSLKLSCHHRDGFDFGLIRVDYNGPRHRNPQVITSQVPRIMHPYAGIDIPPRTGHVHIYVEGEDLKWAMPLKDFSERDEEERDGISVAQIEINSHNEKHAAVQSFANTINLQAAISFTGGLMMN